MQLSVHSQEAQSESLGPRHLPIMFRICNHGQSSEAEKSFKWFLRRSEKQRSLLVVDYDRAEVPSSCRIHSFST